jgi:hypothetical protein
MTIVDQDVSQYVIDDILTRIKANAAGREFYGAKTATMQVYIRVGVSESRVLNNLFQSKEKSICG